MNYLRYRCRCPLSNAYIDVGFAYHHNATLKRNNKEPILLYKVHNYTLYIAHYFQQQRSTMPATATHGNSCQ